MTDEPDTGLRVLPVRGLPEIRSGDDLAGLLSAALAAHGGLRPGDVLVVSSKLVSKAQGLRRPSSEDRHAVVGAQSRRVVAERRTPSGLTRVVEAVAGPVLAAAGVDASNTGPRGGWLLLPEDPDAAARELHAALGGGAFGVVLSDTAGRPWRDGQTDFALGAHGVHVLDDLRGRRDADGRDLAVTARAVADELAAAADLVKGKDSGIGAALLRGLPQAVRPAADPDDSGARSLVRTGAGDWFALGHREAVRSALGAPPGSPAAQWVGVPEVGPEATDVRTARAVRLALLGHPGCAIDGTPGTGLTVRATDPVLAGRVAARLEVALAGEDLTGSFPVTVVTA